MMIYPFKLLITPVLIGLVTFAGRRWGTTVSGLLAGLPLTTGPISFILAHEYGLDFASHAAIGSLMGQVSMCVFCLIYIFMAQKRGWVASVFSALAAFLVSALIYAVTQQKMPV